jgi:hypothetical protein
MLFLEIGLTLYQDFSGHPATGALLFFAPLFLKVHFVIFSFPLTF